MRIILSLVSLIFIASCQIIGDSVNTVLRELPNANRTKKVILFIKRGGATLGDSYQLTISEINYKLSSSEPGNAFVVDDDHSKTSLDSSSIIFSWFSDDSLVVSYDGKLRTFIKKSEVKSVHISYKAR